MSNKINFVAFRLAGIFEKHAQRPFLIDANRNHFSYEETLRQAKCMASFMKQVGIKPGGPVAFSMDNSCELAVLYLAAMLLGVPILPINPGLSTQDFNVLLSNLNADHIFISPVAYDRHHSGFESVPGLQVHCLNPVGQPLKDSHKDLVSMDYDNIVSSCPEFKGSFSCDNSDTLMLMPTSGTSGTPKVLDISWGGLFGNAQLFSEVMGINSNSKFYNILPMTYLGGCYNLLGIPMSQGASVVIGAPFGGAVMYGFWDTIREHKINTLWFTATMLSMLLEIDDGDDVSFLAEQIKLGLVGMAPLSADVKRQFENRFGFRLYENFALSETLFLTSQRVSGLWTPGSSGVPLPGVNVTIADINTGAPLGVEEDGEIKVSTPYRIKGYRLAGETDRDRLLADNGMLTGDIGKFNAAGELLVTGRLKDLIIRGGVNISPKAIEDTLLACSAIAEAAVVGMPDKHYGEEVAAAVQLKADYAETVTEEELLDFCRERLPAFQCPKRIFFMDPLPKGVTGKIQKLAIKKRIVEQLGQST